MSPLIKGPGALFFLALLAVGCGESQTAKKAPKASGADAPSGSSETLLLTWDEYAGGTAEAFNLYVAASASAAGSLVTRVDPDTAGFTASAPAFKVETDQEEALSPYAGKTACFSLTAVVGGAESAPSDAACLKL